MVGLPLLDAQPGGKGWSTRSTSCAPSGRTTLGTQGSWCLIPSRPSIVAANGPRMAAVAGAHADAVNFHDWQDDLPGRDHHGGEGGARRGQRRVPGHARGAVRGEVASFRQQRATGARLPRRHSGDGAMELRVGTRRHRRRESVDRDRIVAPCERLARPRRPPLDEHEPRGAAVSVVGRHVVAAVEREARRRAGPRARHGARILRPDRVACRAV